MQEHSEISAIIRKRIDDLDDSNAMKEFLYSVLEHEVEFLNMGPGKYSELYLKLSQKATQGTNR
jgi:hypothetical protein